MMQLWWKLVKNNHAGTSRSWLPLEYWKRRSDSASWSGNTHHRVMVRQSVLYQFCDIELGRIGATEKDGNKSCNCWCQVLRLLHVWQVFLCWLFRCGTFAYVFHRHRAAFSCVGGEKISFFYTCALAMGAANIVCLSGKNGELQKSTFWFCSKLCHLIAGCNVVVTLFAGLAHNSAKGTMINWWPRRHVSKFVGAKIIMDAALLLFCVPATK